MTGGRKFVIGAGVVLFGAIVAGVVLTSRGPTPSTAVIGAVLEASSDARRQTPVANAEVTASVNGGREVEHAETKTDLSGSFRLTLSPAVKPDESVTLTVRREGYQLWEVTGPIKDQIYLARLVRLHAEQTAAAQANQMTLGDLRVRYSVKVSATLNVGSFARTFEARGSGGLPCDGASTCSPDGRWKAVPSSVSYDAGEGNEFREARVSCIAGPCPFTSVQRANWANPGRMMKVTVLGWSDTTTFLVEAEVTRTQVNDSIRYSIPVVFGNGMDFTLPGTAEGPSIEADLNGTEIVFPLGPDLYLSWASCALKTDKEGAKLYRCELKPGYRFR